MNIDIIVVCILYHGLFYSMLYAKFRMFNKNCGLCPYNRGLTLDNDIFVTGRMFFNFGPLCKIYLLAGVTMTHLYGLFETYEVVLLNHLSIQWRQS